MKNIITVDIDTERETPIKITKGIGVFPEEHEYDNMVIQDTNDLVNTSVYLLSMLDDENQELIVLNKIKDLINKRIDEVKSNTETSQEATS